MPGRSGGVVRCSLQGATVGGRTEWPDGVAGRVCARRRRPMNGSQLRMAYQGVLGAYGEKACPGCDAIANHDISSPALFFHEEALRVGNTMPLYFQAAETSKLGFLRHHTARNMPFSKSNLTRMLALFHIPQGSQEAADVESTLSLCDAPPLHTACVTSVEDMVDRAVEFLCSPSLSERSSQ